jgi:cytochrome c oxidase subunit II
VQKYWSLLFGGTMLACFALFAVAPFVSGWWLPRNVSTFGGGIDGLFYLILAITGFFFVLTEAILTYALWKFAFQPGRKAAYTHGNHRLEVVWTIIPGAILFFLALWQIGVWAGVKYQSRMPRPEDAAVQFEVQARQWEWRMRYPSPARFASWERQPQLSRDFATNPHVDDIHLVNEVHVFKGEKILVYLKTQDILHSFFLPQLRLKQDALPGKTIPVWFAVTESNLQRIEDPDTKQVRWVEKGYDPETGLTTQPDMVWELACAEFCGSRHSLMRGKLFVHETKGDFLEGLRQAEAEQNRTQPVASR